MLYNYLELLRIKSYIKNFAILIPIISTFSFEISIIIKFFQTYILFSILTSSIYIFNDFCDLKNDKEHPIKKFRPMPSGKISKKKSFYLMIFLLVFSLLLSWTFLGTEYFYIFIFYIFLNFFYSIAIKNIFLLDVFFLAIFFLIRVYLGDTIIHHSSSAWLIFFTFFVFLSLGLIKRLSEINLMKFKNKIHKGRPYLIKDYNFVKKFILLNLFLSEIILFYYIAFIVDDRIYHASQYLFFLIPVYLYWIMHLIKNIEKNNLIDDPVMYVSKDKKSYFIFFAILLILIISKGFR